MLITHAPGELAFVTEDRVGMPTEWPGGPVRPRHSWKPAAPWLSGGACGRSDARTCSAPLSGRPLPTLAVWGSSDRFLPAAHLMPCGGSSPTRARTCSRARATCRRSNAPMTGARRSAITGRSSTSKNPLPQWRAVPAPAPATVTALRRAGSGLRCW